MSHRLLLAALCSLPLVSPTAPASADMVSLVRPLAGTERGGVFPGADTPFGMVQYSPNTEGALGGGYRHSRTRTWGFAATHLSGPGCAAMGDVVSLPMTGPVTTVDARHAQASFSHATEQASPGYYAVTLAGSNVRAEVTATTRTGWARFAYPSSYKANVIVDPGANFRGTHDSSVHVVGNDTIEGWVSTWGYWHACPAHGANRYRVYFSMKFSRPFYAYGTGNAEHLYRHHRTAGGRDAGAYVAFDTRHNRAPIVSKVGISYVDLAGARSNLATEGAKAGFDFDAVRDIARDSWENVLDRVQVSDPRDGLRETFYTALYHALLYPNVFSDADGRYEGFDDRVHRTRPGTVHYTNFSMWDTYRTVHPLIDLVAPDVVGDMMGSLLDDAAQSGWLPKWPYAHFETNEMVGDPAANVIADAYLKGLLRPADVGRAYAALIHNATDVPDPAQSPFEGRTGLAGYLNLGYTPYHQAGDYRNAASLNMEYALNDCALALMAGSGGRAADAAYLMRRAKRYRYTIDPRLGLARPRLASGAWYGPAVAASRVGFKEGTAANYTWLVPQDVSGLAKVLGGQAATLNRLDAFFAQPAVSADPAAAATQWLDPGRFNPRNEQDLQAPYLYDYLGEPWKTQDMVRAAEGLFTTAPNGLPSSDDLGTMSAWYVLSALGLYPTTGGDDHYALTTPLFEHVVINPPRHWYPGGPIVIDAPGTAARHRIAWASLNGSPLSTAVISHAALQRGAHLSFALTTAAGSPWGTGPAMPSSACSSNVKTADVRLAIHRGAFRTLRTRVGNPGDAAAVGVRVTLRLPSGWSSVPRVRVLSTLGVRQAVSLRWQLHAPSGQSVARVRADATWSAPGTNGAGSALRTFTTGSGVAHG